MPAIIITFHVPEYFVFNTNYHIFACQTSIKGPLELSSLNLISVTPSDHHCAL